MFTQPNFFFIGGMRCGSTSLNLMLEQHPEIYMSPVKEPYYYLAEALRDIREPSLEEASFLEIVETGGNYRTRETYQSLFQDVGGAKIVGEASHYLYHSKTAARIAKECPEARILVCLRNPIDRFFSEYLLLLRRGAEKGRFLDFVARYAKPYLDGDASEKSNVPKLNKGLQADLLTPWIAQFGRATVKLVLFDDLKHAPKDTMTDIFRWLDINADFSVQRVHVQKGGAQKAKWVTSMMNSKHRFLLQAKSLIPRSAKLKYRALIFSRTLERPEMEAEAQEMLIKFYQDDVEKLSYIVGKDLSEWCRIR